MEFRKILLEVSIEQLKRDWVGEGPHKISEELFELLCRLTNNKSAYTTWLVKKVGDGVIPSTPSVLEREFKDVFSIFDKHKQNFSKKDINQYKTTEDILDFIRQAREIEKEESEKKEVSDFKIGSAKVNGKVYDVYRLPKGNLENKPIAVKLGRNNTGQKGWCVSYDGPSPWYASYINKENLYFIINPADRLRDKYCLQYNYFDSRPFDLSDNPIPFEEAIAFYPVYQLILAKDEKPIPYFVRVAAETAEALKANTTLKDIEVADNLYRIELSDPLSTWLKPMLQLAGIIDTDNTHSLPEEKIVDITDKLRRSLSSAEGYDGIYYYRLDGTRIFAIPYTGSESFFTYSVFGQLFTGRPFIGLQKILNEDNARHIYFQLKEVLDSVGLNLPATLVYAFNKDSLPPLEDYHKGSEKKVSYYIVPPNVQSFRILMEATENASDSLEFVLNLSNRLRGQTIGIAKQKDNCIIFPNLYTADQSLKIYRYVKGYPTSQDNYNPDVLYEMYKSLKSYDNSVEFPELIQRVHDIKEGEFNQYKVNNIGHTKELFRLPADLVSSIPYSIPEVGAGRVEFFFLGFISKWQFVLTNTGRWILTGRWGSSGSPSWISSVSGLGETLEAICNYYQIPRPVQLREWRAKNPNAPRIEVPREEPANQTDDSNVPFRNLPIEERLQRAADAGLLQEETMHIADYTFRGRQGHITLQESCLHGPWEDFRQSFLRTLGSTSTVRIAEQFVESKPGTRISEVYVWPVAGGSWNGIFVIRRGEQAIRVIRRMGEQGNFSYRTYSNGPDWTLTI